MDQVHNDMVGQIIADEADDAVNVKTTMRLAMETGTVFNEDLKKTCSE